MIRGPGQGTIGSTLESGLHTVPYTLRLYTCVTEQTLPWAPNSPTYFLLISFRLVGIIHILGALRKASMISHRLLRYAPLENEAQIRLT